MRGRHDPQATMLAFVDLEERVPQDHPIPLSKTGAELLFEVFSHRYERGSVLVTTNLPFDEWTEVFGSERLTGALLDRLTHRVHILDSLVKTRFEEVPAISHICALPYVGVVYVTETVYCTPARVRLF